MDTLDTLSTHQHHPHVSSAFLLTETAAAAAHHHFNVLSFETCLYKGGSGASSGGSPTPASVCASEGEIGSEGPPGDLNTPVTTASDAPSFFGPSTVIEPPPITGQLKIQNPKNINLVPRELNITFYPSYVRNIYKYAPVLSGFLIPPGGGEREGKSLGNRSGRTRHSCFSPFMKTRYYVLPSPFPALALPPPQPSGDKCQERRRGKGSHNLLTAIKEIDNQTALNA